MLIMIVGREVKIVEATQAQLERYVELREDPVVKEYIMLREIVISHIKGAILQGKDRLTAKDIDHIYKEVM